MAVATSNPLPILPWAAQSARSARVVERLPAVLGGQVEDGRVQIVRQRGQPSGRRRQRRMRPRPVLWASRRVVGKRANREVFPALSSLAGAFGAE